MKTPRSLLLITALSLFALPAQAKGPRGSGADAPGEGRGARPRPGTTAPAQGLQLANGLQTSGSLDGAALSVRLSDEEWRKTFERKVVQK